jgi:hypothetical protein
MSFTDTLIALFGALILIVVVLGGFVFLLLYGDQLFPGAGTPSVSCTEEDQGGLCGIRHALEQHRSAQGTIEL